MRILWLELQQYLWGNKLKKQETENFHIEDYIMNSHLMSIIHLNITETIIIIINLL